MEIIKIEDYKTRFPIINDGIDIDTMSEEIIGFHFAMYSLYTDFLVNYIIKNTSLKQREETLINSQLLFPIDDEDKDFYQSTTGRYLNYFYIRNNIHIENLTNDETNFLINKIRNDEFEYDAEVEKFIKNTFSKVINDYDISKPPVTINYGPIAEQYYAPTNSLILGFRFNEDVIDVENKIKKIEQSNNIALEIEKEISEKLGVNARVIIYDSYSVKKKLTNNLSKK